MKKSSLAAATTLACARGEETAENGRNTDVIKEPAREIPVAGDFDICVVGGSCTGVFAAVAAARLGARAAVIENNGFFGGVAAASLVNIWHSPYDTVEEKQIIAGLSMEMIERLEPRGAVSRGQSGYSFFRLNTEELKIELDLLVKEAGVRPFLHTLFVSPVMREGKLEAVVIEDKSGRRAIRASYFIDATGDGDLIARMGLPFYKSGNIQPPTTCAILRGLERIRKKYPDFNLEKVIFDPQYPLALKKGFAWGAPVPGSLDEYMLAGTRVFGADCSVAEQLTQAEMDGRRQVRAICDILRENFIHDQFQPLVTLPAKIGIRETRHARCLHQLTEQEVLYGKRFPDAIANGSYRVDIHLADREGLIFRYLDGTEVLAGIEGNREEGRWREELPENPTFYQIPYSSLVPRDSKNVLVAGRILDADPGAFGAVRVMINCNQTGQAAGTAACLALDSKTTFAQVDPQKLREVLSQQGAIII
ncbi:MAG TPA: FAD-dependent oxidoreductase [archaeon]|nr:FAD-dependent oxidoreductase [archaeon]